MNRLFTFLFFSAAFTISLNAQNWDDDDYSRQNNDNNRQWNNPNQGWQQGKGYDYNPYQDPNYYPTGYRGCTPPPPPPPPCRRNVVIVTPPPSFYAPIVIAPMRPVYYRPYRYNPYRSYGYGHGWRGR